MYEKCLKWFSIEHFYYVFSYENVYLKGKLKIYKKKKVWQLYSQGLVIVNWKYGWKKSSNNVFIVNFNAVVIYAVVFGKE